MKTKPTPSIFDGKDPAAQIEILRAIYEDDTDQAESYGLIKLVVWSLVAITITAAVVVAVILI